MNINFVWKGSWTSLILIGLIAIVGLDIFVILMFFVYKLIEWCRNSNNNFPEDETILFEDMVAIQTKPVPVVFEDAFTRVNTLKDKNKTRITASDDFDVAMYISEVSKGNSLENSEVENEQQPAISLSIHFDTQANELTIVLGKGKNIRCEAISEQQQQHIQVSAMLMPDGNILHSCRGIPPSPLFKYKYNFHVKAEHLKSSIVKFNIWKIDKYSRKTPFGDCILNLENVFTDANDYLANIWLEIQRKEELENETMKGELLTLIQYLPGSERINVNITKGRGFYFEDFDKDVYIKASAVVNRKVIKNRKTSNAKKSPNPVFNEMTQFQLDTEMTLENTTLILSVYVHRSRGPHKRLIGRCYIGNGELSESTGREYWREIITNPQKMVAKWQEVK